MLERLPIELKLLLLQEDNQLLRYVSKDFYRLHNLVVKDRISRILPIGTIDFSLFKAYQNSLRFFNGDLSDVLLPELNYSLYYAFLRNRKIYFDPEDCQIQRVDETEPPELSSYEFLDGSLKLNKVQSFLYQKTFNVPPGIYNFELALINHRFCKGLGTMSFTITDESDKIFRFYPTTYLHELMPTSGINIVNLGLLEITGDKSSKVTVTIEEVGPFPKLNLEFLYFQFNPFVDQFNNDYLFYTVDKEEHFLERMNYMSIQGLKITSDYEPNEKEDYEQFYTSGERSLKMLFPSDQRKIKEKKPRIPIRPWKVPF